MYSLCFSCWQRQGGTCQQSFKRCPIGAGCNKIWVNTDLIKCNASAINCFVEIQKFIVTHKTHTRNGMKPKLPLLSVISERKWKIMITHGKEKKTFIRCDVNIVGGIFQRMGGIRGPGEVPTHCNSQEL